MRTQLFEGCGCVRLSSNVVLLSYCSVERLLVTQPDRPSVAVESAGPYPFIHSFIPTISSRTLDLYVGQVPQSSWITGHHYMHINPKGKHSRTVKVPGPRKRSCSHSYLLCNWYSNSKGWMTKSCNCMRYIFPFSVLFIPGAKKKTLWEVGVTAGSSNRRHFYL